MQELAALIIFFASLHLRKGCQLLIIKLCWVVLRMRSFADGKRKEMGMGDDPRELAILMAGKRRSGLL